MEDKKLTDFLDGKTEYTLKLFRLFVIELEQFGPIHLIPLKSMIAVEGKHKFAYITQLGKNFIHLVIPFSKPFNDNFCFSKIAQVPGASQYNHHLRIYFEDDFNAEVKQFLKMAYDGNNILS